MDALEYQNILGKTGVLLTEDFKALSKNARTKVELLPQNLPMQFVKVIMRL
jgi:hypothetical protein